MFRRSLLQSVEPPGIAIDGSVAQDYKLIGEAMSHIGAQMYAGVLTGFFNLFSFKLGDGLPYLATITAGYLFILDYTNWRTNVSTALLVPYIVLNLPTVFFDVFRGETGQWLAFVALVIRLFFPTRVPKETKLPGSLIILVVTTPAWIISWRFDHVGWPGQVISILIAAYLLFQHISSVTSVGGAQKLISPQGAAGAVGILRLFVAPIWQFFL